MSELPPLVLKGKRLLPIVQGGMGVGISAHRLAGAVARLNAVGTISSVDLRRGHADLMAATGKSRDKEAIRRANLNSDARRAASMRPGSCGNGLESVPASTSRRTLASSVSRSAAS